VNIKFRTNRDTFDEVIPGLLEPDCPGPEWHLFVIGVYWWIEGVNVMRYTDSTAEELRPGEWNSEVVPSLGFVQDGYFILRTLQSGASARVFMINRRLLLERSGRRLRVSTTRFPEGKECDYEEAVAEFRRFVRRVRQSFEEHAPLIFKHRSARQWFEGADDADQVRW